MGKKGGGGRGAELENINFKDLNCSYQDLDDLAVVTVGTMFVNESNDRLLKQGNLFPSLHWSVPRLSERKVYRAMPLSTLIKFAYR